MISNLPRIWIIGDSWGDDLSTALDVPPDRAITSYFTSKKYEIFNCARAGISNDSAMRYAEQAAARGAELPTHVIHFWTEPLRDFPWDKASPEKQYNLKKETLKLEKKQSDQLLNLKKKLNNPHWALIGGQSPYYKNLDRLAKCSFSIPNWRNEILNKDYEFYASTMAGLVSLNTNIKWDSESTRILLESTEIRKTMVESNLFPDNAHPAMSCYEQLFARILSWTNETTCR